MRQQSRTSGPSLVGEESRHGFLMGHLARTPGGDPFLVLGYGGFGLSLVLLTGDLAMDASQAGDVLIDALATAADPDLALAALARMPRDAELIRALGEGSRLRARLAAVLGASAALGDHLARHPEHWQVLSG